MFSSYLNNVNSAEWLLVLSSLGLLLILINISYNLFFHPLAHVPGPFWSRISSLPSWYHACRGDRHIWLWQLFQIYGDRIRSAPNTVLFCDPKAYTDIHNIKSNVRRASFYPVFQMKHHEPMTITVSDVSEHTRRRRRLLPIFNEKSLHAASIFIIDHVERWIQILTEDNEIPTEWSSPINLARKFDFLTFDISGDLNFGASFGSKEPTEVSGKLIPDYVSQFLRFHYIIARSPFADLFLWMRPRGLDFIIDSITPSPVKTFNEFLYNSVTKRLALQKEQAEKPEAERRQDLFHFLHEAKDPDTSCPAYNESDLRGESTLLLIAGSDTTSTALTGIFFCLTGDPRRYQKLVDEILSTFDSAEDIVHGSKLIGCQYLRACVDEALRLNPSLLGDLPREVLPGGITIKGEYYPTGTIVGDVPWATMRNEDVYGDPEVFRPERWILDESAGVTKEAIAQAKSCFHPFSAGPGNCVGQNLAIVIILITVARTLYHLDVRRVPGSTFGGGSPTMGWGSRNRNQLQLRDIFAAMKEGPEVQFRKRVLSS
ncbi:cytochrome P450 monooxygenase-like protein [Daldinia sp. FL1419]|nr:cytochrome P450 monooxygenase-like protein [Daldinia sp. FL1419]